MDNNFEKWLKIDDLYQYYLDNPKQQEEIYIGYLQDVELSNSKTQGIPLSLDDKIDFIQNNENVGKKLFPYTHHLMIMVIHRSHPLRTYEVFRTAIGIVEKTIYDQAPTSKLIRKKKLQRAKDLLQYMKPLKDNEAEEYRDLYKKELPILNELKKEIDSLLANKTTKQLTSFYSPYTPEQLVLLYNEIINTYIDCSLKDFKLAFSSNPLPSGYNKIKWKMSEPLFCCIIYGYNIPEIGVFSGIGEKGAYKKATELFSFNTKTTNKTLSSTFQKKTSSTKVKGLNKLDRILKAVLQVLD